MSATSMEALEISSGRRRIRDSVSQVPAGNGIALAECQHRHAYRLDARRITIGVFDGEAGFVGIREKAGRHYLFREFHQETGWPHGTVWPLSDLGQMPDDVVIEEWFWLDANTGRPIIPVERSEQAWRYEDTGQRGHNIEPRPVLNQRLFDWLEDLEASLVPEAGVDTGD